jgi:predicted ribosome quality control (RQC) complex YloA/Tae2 family protein
MKTFTSLDGVKIHVGENAKDNDRLTESSYPREWWMHVSGHPGSHVVIACEEDVLPRETKRDAAVLAVRHSKAPPSKMVKVDLCRVEDLGMGRASGQVYLDGETTQLTIFMGKERERIERLVGTPRRV